MNKLPISIGILAWKSGQTLVDTLTTYYMNGLFDIVTDVNILFQEVSDTDVQIAKHFNIPYIPLQTNIGIGRAFVLLTMDAKTENVIVLEHDWHLIEGKEIVYNRLHSGIDMLNNGFHAVRYRHRTKPGYPHFSFRHRGNELEYYDDWAECTSPHLLDSLHWLDPVESFPDKIGRDGEYFTTTSRWGNWTNNPTMYKKEFYINTVTPFAGDGIDLEKNITKWWAEQNYKVAHGEGLFSHIDKVKYRM